MIHPLRKLAWTITTPSCLSQPGGKMAEDEASWQWRKVAVTLDTKVYLADTNVSTVIPKRGRSDTSGISGNDTKVSPSAHALTGSAIAPAPSRGPASFSASVVAYGA